MGKLVNASSISMKGDVLFSRILTGGAYGGLYKIANATAFGIQPQNESESIQGTELDNFGQTLDTLNQAGDILISLSANRFNGRSLALALMGDESEITGGSTAVTDETVAFDGDVAHLGRQNLVAASVAIRGLDLTVDSTTGFTAGDVLTNQTTGATIGVIADVPDATSIHVFLTDVVPSDGDVVTDGTDTATIAGSGVANKNDLAALTTDFTEDTTNGRITRVSAGALDVANLTKVQVNYNYTADAGSRIVIASNTIIKGRLVLKGINRVTNKRVHVDLRQVNIAPNASIPFMGDDRSEVTWEGTAETPTGQSDPGLIDLGA